MSRVSLFNSPLFLGFDRFERVFDHIAKTQADGYPHYNIKQLSDSALRISVATAGFNKNDLSVTVIGNQLIIKGRHDDTDDANYLYRGIATRQFQRTFALAEGVEITNADFDNGLLNIDLSLPRVTETVKEIPINVPNDEDKKNVNITP